MQIYKALRRFFEKN